MDKAINPLLSLAFDPVSGTAVHAYTSAHKTESSQFFTFLGADMSTERDTPFRHFPMET